MVCNRSKKPAKDSYGWLPEEQCLRDVDVVIIPELLGHKSSKTAEIYTHVSNKDISKIKCPLDSLQMKGGGDD